MTMSEKEVESFDEAWDDAELDETQEDEKEEEKDVTEEVDESEKEEDTDDSDDDKAEEESDEEEDDTEEEAEEEKKSSVDWVGLGFDKFKGKTDEEVVAQIKFERQQLGHTVNMLGDLRREIADLKKQPPPKKEVEKPKDVLASIPDLDDADAAKFNAMYEKNPIKAIMTYGGDPIKEMVAEEVKRVVPKQESVAEVKEEIAYSTFVNTVKPTALEVEQMKIFDKPEYLGSQARPYADLYGLSKIWLSDSVASEGVYELMRKHPTMSFDEASNFMAKPKKEVDKAKIKQTINKNKKVESHPKKKSQAMPSSDLSFDEAWDSA